MTTESAGGAGMSDGGGTVEDTGKGVEVMASPLTAFRWRWVERRKEPMSGS